MYVDICGFCLTNGPSVVHELLVLSKENRGSPNVGL